MLPHHIALAVSQVLLVTLDQQLIGPGEALESEVRKTPVDQSKQVVPRLFFGNSQQTAGSPVGMLDIDWELQQLEFRVVWVRSQLG